VHHRELDECLLEYLNDVGHPAEAVVVHGGCWHGRLLHVAFEPFFAGQVDRPWYKVTGKFVGYGSDGEPLISDYKSKKASKSDIESFKQSNIELNVGDVIEYPKYKSFSDRFIVDGLIKSRHGELYGYSIRPDYFDIPYTETVPYWKKRGPDTAYLSDQNDFSKIGVMVPADPILRDQSGKVIPLSQRIQQSSSIKLMPDPSIPGAYSMSGYRILPGKTKGKLRVYSPSGALVGVVGSVDDAQRMIQKKLQ
jgi:hypothetical protein